MMKGDRSIVENVPPPDPYTIVTHVMISISIVVFSWISSVRDLLELNFIPSEINTQTRSDPITRSEIKLLLSGEQRSEIRHKKTFSLLFLDSWWPT